MNHPDTVAAIVVTYNRKMLLLQCLAALLAQSRPPDKIFVVDNASADGTAELLDWQAHLRYPTIDYMLLSENSGGAGGFYEGMKRACEAGFDWLWLMDDDALPANNALEELLTVPLQQDHVYGSVAVAADNDAEPLCWPVALANSTTATVRQHLTDALEHVGALPFLGFFINTRLVHRIGYPDKSLFIAGDDVDYCQRALRQGASIVLVRDSVIYHPLPKRQIFSFLGRRFFILSLPPWKTYYDVRNRLIIGRRYHGLRVWTETIPGTLVRLCCALLSGSSRSQRLRAFLAGFYDGLSNRTGRRWTS